MAGPTDKLPIDQIARMDYDNSLLFFGVVPLVIIGVVAVVLLVLHFVRRGKNWSELGEAMRADEDSREGRFASDQLEAMDPTKPSQRLRSIPRNNLAERDDD